jgi:hypothetical protein
MINFNPLLIILFIVILYSLAAMIAAFINQQKAAQAFKQGLINPQLLPVRRIEGNSPAQSISLFCGITLILPIPLFVLNMVVGSSSALVLILLIYGFYVLLATPVMLIANIPLIWNKEYAQAEAVGLFYKLKRIMWLRIILWTNWISYTLFLMWFLFYVATGTY